MDFNEILKTGSSIVALVIAILALLKSAKMFPVEKANVDADAANKYAEVAGHAAEQVNQALKRIDSLEIKSKDLARLVDGLRDTLYQRDLCIETMNREIKSLNQEIQARDRLIEKWAKGLKILTTQLVDSGITPLWSPDPDFSITRKT